MYTHGAQLCHRESANPLPPPPTHTKKYAPPPHTSPSVHPFVRPQGLAPRDAWEACPEEGKLQIIGFVGVLETVTELIKPHYTKAGKSAYPPMIKPRKGYFNSAILEGESGAWGRGGRGLLSAPRNTTEQN